MLKFGNTSLWLSSLGHSIGSPATSSKLYAIHLEALEIVIHPSELPSPAPVLSMADDVQGEAIADTSSVAGLPSKLSGNSIDNDFPPSTILAIIPFSVSIHLREPSTVSWIGPYVISSPSFQASPPPDHSKTSWPVSNWIWADIGPAPLPYRLSARSPLSSNQI